MCIVIYFLQRANGDIKIGYTNDYDQRLSHLVMEHGPLKQVGLIPGTRETEHLMHTIFSHLWTLQGEWFRDSAEIHAFLKATQQMPIPDRKHRISSRKTTPKKIEKWIASQPQFDDMSADDAMKLLMTEHEAPYRVANVIGVCENAVRTWIKERGWKYTEQGWKQTSAAPE